jgi:hypothetical protein
MEDTASLCQAAMIRFPALRNFLSVLGGTSPIDSKGAMAHLVLRNPLFTTSHEQYNEANGKFAKLSYGRRMQ